MSYNFKKLSDVEVVENLSNEVHFLIEDDKEIKRVPENKVGGIQISDAEPGQTIVVKTVDENGRPTSWESANLVREWEDLENKPFYEQENIIFNEQVELQDDNIVYLDTIFTLEEWGNYKVVVDDAEFLVKCVFDDTDSSPVLHINNGNWTINIFSDYRNECFVDAYDITGTHSIKIIDLDNPTIKPLDKKFIPGLPCHVKVRRDSDGNYYSNFTYGEIEGIAATGTPLYATIESEISGKWITNLSYGYYYFGYYTMPDDDILIFTNPSKNDSSIVFYNSAGTIAVS